ncbi:hypothetical protein K474DRAFT_1712825 [Panus rudis PR-1116 ss-1]|nr:hypothetical protein K474DRAFT_1712825 [Panus rudis PR-1116 ss-1]
MSQPTNTSQTTPAQDPATLQALLNALQQSGGHSGTSVGVANMGPPPGLNSLGATLNGSVSAASSQPVGLGMAPVPLPVIQQENQVLAEIAELRTALQQTREERQQEIRAAVKHAVDELETSESSEGPRKCRRRQTGGSSVEKPKEEMKLLSGGLMNLDGKQRSVRKSLQEMVEDRLTVITGITGKKFPALGDIEGNYPMAFNFTKNVDESPNKEVIQRAIILVHKEELQCDPEDRNIVYPDIDFSNRDHQEIGHALAALKT